METTSPVEKAMNALEKRLIQDYPAGVPRQLIGKATGHILNPLTCASDDSLGNGISDRYKANGKVIYPVSGIMKKIRAKAQNIDKKES